MYIATFLKCSFPDSYLEELQPSFEIDPLLLRFFVYRTPLNKLSSLFGKIPISVVLMRLAQEFHEPHEFYKPQEFHVSEKVNL